MNSLSFLQQPGAATILALTLAFSLAGLLGFPGLIERCVLRPYWLVRRGQWHTLVTSGLVHADFGHLLLNMLTFWFFAFQLERAIGTTRFVLLYVLALVASDANTYLKHRGEPEYGSLGASGAIAAVLFASIVYYPDQSLFIIPIPVPIPAPLFAVGYVAYSWYSARQARGRINHDAHLGGALFGLLFVALTDPSAFRGLAALLG
jgi:membrane associated rhomboid family serine protease